MWLILSGIGEKINEVDLPVYLPNFFKSVVRTVYEEQLQLDSAKSRKDIHKEKADIRKKRVIKKEIVDVSVILSLLACSVERPVCMYLIMQ